MFNFDKYRNYRYRTDIDGLRALAVISVVCFHAFPQLVGGGFIGVDIFFVISGFLISSIIFNQLDLYTFSFINFYSNRVRRIFPALGVVLLVAFAFGWFVLLTDEYKQLGMHIASGAGFISNIILLRESGYFDSAADLKPLLHLWSLGIEEQFYIFWPLLIAIIWRWRINPLLIIGLITITSFSLNIRGVDKNAIAAFYSPQTRFWELSIGAIVAYCQLRPSNNVVSFLSTIDSFLSKFNSFRKKKDANSLNSILGTFLSLFGIACIGYGIFYLSGSVKYPGYWALLPTLGTVCLICAGPNAWINHVFLSNNFMVCVGLLVILYIYGIGCFYLMQGLLRVQFRQ